MTGFKWINFKDQNLVNRKVIAYLHQQFYDLPSNLFLRIHLLREKCPLRNYFWSVFSCIRTEHRRIRTRNNSVFGHFSRNVSIANAVFSRQYWSILFMYLASQQHSPCMYLEPLTFARDVNPRVLPWQILFHSQDTVSRSNNTRLRISELWGTETEFSVCLKTLIIRQKGESQNGCSNKTKHDKFYEKRASLTP